MRRSVLVAGVVLILVGCGEPTPPATSPAASSADAVAARFNPTDRAWLELMIPLDEQLLPALELAATNSANPSVRAFAADVAASVHSELGQLRELGAQAQLPADNPHAGHRMTGLVDADTLAALRRSPPATFDPALLTVVRDNAGQVTLLAGAEQQSGAESRTRALAAAITTTRSSQRPTLTSLLGGVPS